MRPGTISDVLCCRAFITAICTAVWLHGAAAERLDRGVVGVRRADGANYISWRLLAEDPPTVTFRVYGAAESRDDGTMLAELRDKCDFSDPTPGNRQYYRVVPVTNGSVLNSVGAVRIDQSTPGYVRIRLEGNYRAQKIGLADLDGDGRLDFIVKQPDFNTDPYQQPGYWKKSEDTYKIEAYRHDGTFMWRYDMGWAIEEGIWYSPIVAYDLDGDGKAEVFCKGGTNYWLYTAAGKLIGHTNLGDLSPKAVYWLEGSTKAYVVGQRIFVWPNREIGRIEGRVVCIADCIGDWREEIITALEGEIRIYTTTTPALFRRVCLMQDRLYRNDVAVQTMGYFYPPQLGKSLR